MTKDPKEVNQTKALEPKLKEEVEKVDRPITTLFMLMSVDGKISTGATDELDVDRDFPGIQECDMNYDV